MIGRSLIIFQLGNNQNEIHSTSSWGLCLGSQFNPDDFDQKIVKQAQEDGWKAEEIVSDAEVEAIVNATCCIAGQPGYHKWASDGVRVINRSDDPNLYNPAKVKAAQRKAQEDKRQEALGRLKEYLPELVKLRGDIPVGTIELNIVVPLKLHVEYRVWRDIASVDVIRDGKKIDHTCFVVPHDHIRELPEMSHIVNCPHRKAYDARCEELANLLGLTTTDVKNRTSSAADGQTA